MLPDELYASRRSGLEAVIGGQLFKVARDDNQTGTLSVHIRFQARSVIPRYHNRVLMVNVKRLTPAEYVLVRLMPAYEELIWPIVTKCLVRYGRPSQKMYPDWTDLAGGRREKDMILKAFELIVEYQDSEMLFGKPINISEIANLISGDIKNVV